MNPAGDLIYDVFVNDPPPQDGVLPNGEPKRFSPMASTLLYGREDAVLTDPGLTPSGHDLVAYQAHGGVPRDDRLTRASTSVFTGATGPPGLGHWKRAQTPIKERAMATIHLHHTTPAPDRKALTASPTSTPVR